MGIALDSGPLLERRLRAGNLVALDGGFATELERRGHDLGDALWSARILLTEPEAIRRLHHDYLGAGAECITTASYQASLPGLQAAGLSPSEAASVMVSAVELAESACREFGEEHGARPLVAASVGPYGAYLADGSEYRGNYGVSARVLREYHGPRWELLASRCSLLACETLPSFAEARVLLKLLAATPEARAWFAFSCRDGTSISDGTPIAECVELCASGAASDQVLAIGVNCTAPRYLPALVTAVREASPKVPVIVYPNSGETYLAEVGDWVGEAERLDFATAVPEWCRLGARLVGGCCRTTPDDVRAIRRALDGQRPHRDVSPHQGPLGTQLGGAR